MRPGIWIRLLKKSKIDLKKAENKYYLLLDLPGLKFVFSFKHVKSSLRKINQHNAVLALAKISVHLWNTM